MALKRAVFAGGARPSSAFRQMGVMQFSDAPSIDLGTPIISNFTQNVDASVLPAFSLATASNMEVVQHKKSLAVAKFKAHSTDTGSAPVQIAVMTEKILNLAKHAIAHKKDKHSIRGYQILLARRKKMMKYLKRKDFELFKETVTALGLEKEASHIKN